MYLISAYCTLFLLHKVPLYPQNALYFYCKINVPYIIFFLGGIEDDVQNLLAMATVQGVPYLFSVPRRKLGHLTFKSSLISCLAVLDYSGCEVRYLVYRVSRKIDFQSSCAR